MKGHGSKLNRKMDAAIIGLLTQHNLEEAARSAGIGLATLRRWQDLPKFDKAFRRARRQAFGQQISRLQHASSAAVTTLQKLVVDPSSPPAVRARAAYYIIMLGNKSIEIDDIEQRLAELERCCRGSEAVGMKKARGSRNLPRRA